jgi:hypothetical protein
VLGPVAEVLTPSLLADVFEVEAALVEGQLRFA